VTVLYFTCVLKFLKRKNKKKKHFNDPCPPPGVTNFEINKGVLAFFIGLIKINI
jgi:hypothetical protein